jgi:hypothetical protein
MLTNGEVLRIKSMTGYNVTGIGASLYIEYMAVFDQAIQPYLIDLSTSCSTMVTASPAPGATVALTLTSNPTVPGNNVQPLAFVQGESIVVDVGPNVEFSEIQVISGLTIWAQLSLAHGVNGAYPIKPKGAEYVIRNYMHRYDVIDAQLTAYAPLMAGVQEVVGDVKLYQSERAGRRGTTLDKHGSLISQRTQVKRDLCAALGIPFLNDARAGGGQRLSPY